ncbi:MAG: nicotinate (nicotinamide) nucleotide adenylyltransferase [Oscillospiraceae bacterium]
MNIGLFGGSFNPIHNGHIHLAKSVNSAINLDKTILIPSKISPHKSNDEYVSNEHRFNMCKLAIENLPNFEVSDFELSREGISYSIYTVRHFKEKYPNDNLFLLIGSDMFLTFDQWRDYIEIMSKVTLAVISRQDGDYNSLLEKSRELSRYGKIVIPKVKPLEVSSTEIRKNIAFNKYYPCNLDEKVVQYIKSNNLYR